MYKQYKLRFLFQLLQSCFCTFLPMREKRQRGPPATWAP